MSAMTKRDLSTAERGFSLIELMVALVIGMLAMLVILQTFAVFEGQKRTTVSGADAQESGLMALHAIETEVRMAGLGTATLDCPTVNAYNANLVPPDFQFSTVPVVVEQDTPTPGSDRITVFYANSSFGAIPATITSPMPDSSAILNVNFGLGFTAGALFLISEGGKPCSIAQASQNGQKTGKDWNVQHNPGFPYNPPGGHNIFPPGGYGAGAKITDLGQFVRLQFYVENSQLMVKDTNLPDSATNPIALIGGIVAIRGQYGRDTDANGFIDVWDNAAGVTQKQVLAVRLALIARSDRFEKDAVTTAKVSFWPGGPEFDPMAAGDDRYFRYKVYNTVVPLRNVLWNP